MHAKETTMKRNAIAKAFAIAAVTAIALGIAPEARAADNKGCSNASLKGTFVHLGSGFMTSPSAAASPFAGLGTESFDGKGGVVGNATASVNGNIIGGTFTGTYSVNPDCSGTITAQLSIGITTHQYFVLVWTTSPSGTGFNELQFVSTDAGNVETGIAKRQFPVGDVRDPRD